MRSAKLIVAGTAIALALSACGGSSGKSAAPDTTTTVASSGSGDFCADVKDEVAAFDIAGISVKSPEELKATYEDLAPKLEQLASEAPSEIKTDFENFIAVERKVAGLLADADYDPSQVSISSIPELALPATFRSVQRIGTYLRDECGLEGSNG